MKVEWVSFEVKGVQWRLKGCSLGLRGGGEG